MIITLHYSVNVSAANEQGFGNAASEMGTTQSIRELHTYTHTLTHAHTHTRTHTHAILCQPDLPIEVTVVT